MHWVTWGSLGQRAGLSPGVQEALPSFPEVAQVLGPHPAGSRGLESLTRKFRGPLNAQSRGRWQKCKTHETRSIARPNHLLPSQGNRLEGPPSRQSWDLNSGLPGLEPCPRCSGGALAWSSAWIVAPVMRRMQDCGIRGTYHELSEPHSRLGAGADSAKWLLRPARTGEALVILGKVFPRRRSSFHLTFPSFDFSPGHAAPGCWRSQDQVREVGGEGAVPAGGRV